MLQIKFLLNWKKSRNQNSKLIMKEMFVVGFNFSTGDVAPINFFPTFAFKNASAERNPISKDKIETFSRAITFSFARFLVAL